MPRETTAGETICRQWACAVRETSVEAAAKTQTEPRLFGETMARIVLLDRKY